MFQLTISAACSYVRRSLDELTSVEEIGMLVSPDAVDIHKLVEGAIVEAVVKTHSQAPASMIDGIKGECGEGYDYLASVKDGVITITMLKDTLRLASIKAVDSEVVVCDVIPEDSAEGRKQLNRYVRGVPDDPRVVMQKVWDGEYRPVYKYYTIENPTAGTASVAEMTPEINSGVGSDFIIPPTDNDIPSIDLNASPVELYYVPYPRIEETVVQICPQLEYAVLNEVTAMVLESLNENDKAALWREKAVNYMKI